KLLITVCYVGYSAPIERIFSGTDLVVQRICSLKSGVWLKLDWNRDCNSCLLALVLDTTPTFKPLEKHPEIKECNERLFRADDRCNIQKALENVRGQIGEKNPEINEQTQNEIRHFFEDDDDSDNKIPFFTLENLEINLKNKSISDYRLQYVAQYLRLVNNGYAKITASEIISKSINHGLWMARLIRSWAIQYQKNGEISI
ncbi:3540_t:CDS:2, partial [Entrophospora sp. SA101]